MKLDVNILSNEKIKLIRKFPSGDSLFVLWVGILCLAMKSRIPGVLMISEGSPYTPDDLCTATDLDKKTVQMGLELFVRYGMISIDKYNTINVTSMGNYQSFDKIKQQRELSYERVKRHRIKEKQLKIGLDKSDMITRYTVTSNATDIDIDIDIDKDIYNTAGSDGVPSTEPLPLNSKIDMSKNKENNGKTTKKSTRHSAPRDDAEVLEYSKDIGFNIDWPYMRDYYASRGIVVKDWKACARTWKSNAEKRGNINRPQPTATYQGQGGKLDPDYKEADVTEFYEHMKRKLKNQ
jgi:predicted phage replisome organizer